MSKLFLESATSKITEPSNFESFDLSSAINNLVPFCESSEITSFIEASSLKGYKAII